MKRGRILFVWAVTAWMLVLAGAAYGVTEAEYNALVDLYNSTGGAYWTDNTGWFDPEIDPCNWYGISCLDERVVNIDLSENNLIGSIPDSIADFNLLNFFRLSNNGLTGPIPPGIGNLQNLRYIFLDSNELEGMIPTELSNLAVLLSLDISNNNLSGSIPPELGNFQSIQNLDLNANQLTGSIPRELSNLTNLLSLLLFGNELSGSIPPELGNLTTLNALVLGNNQLSGPIPPEIGNLIALEEIDIARNALEGPVPETLMNLTNLTDNTSDFRYNNLYTDNEELRLFMNQKQIDGDWMSTQQVPAGGNAVPAILLDGVGAYTYNTPEGTTLAIEVLVIDHDGIAPDGSSHQVTAKLPDGSTLPLELSSAESDISAWFTYYAGEASPGLYTFTVTDAEGNTATVNDTLDIDLLAPPDANSMTPSLKNPVNEYIRASFDNIRINGQLYEDFDTYASMDEIDEGRWLNWCGEGTLSIRNGKLVSELDNAIGFTSCSLATHELESFSSVSAEVTLEDTSSGDHRARIYGPRYNDGTYNINGYIAVENEKVIYYIGYQTKDTTWVELVNEELMTYTPGQTVNLSIRWDGSRFVFDADGNSAVYQPEGTIIPAVYTQIRLNTTLYLNTENTTPTFTWNPVPDAVRYRVRIYTEGGQTVWRGYVNGQTRYTIPPGVLKPNNFYQYRLDIRDSHIGLEIDNFSKATYRNQDKFTFRTGAESVDPYISLDNTGVETWSDQLGGTYLGFWIEVHDAQGVPENIASVTVTFPAGEQIHLYHDPGSRGGATWGIYRTDSFLPIQSGTYTFTVTDRDGHTVSTTEILDPNPIGYPADETLRPVHGTVIDGTAVNFDWEDVPGVAFYRVEIYDKNRNRIDTFDTTESRYALPAGVLAANTLYRYRIVTRREFFDQNVDNGSSSSLHRYVMPSFITGARTGGSQSPVVGLGGFGVAMYYDPEIEKSSLDFYIIVTDGDGVPENIRSVSVTYPDGVTTQALYYLDEYSDTEAGYYGEAIFESADAIQNGTYTFTVTDFDGNTAQVTDDLVKNELPMPINLTPAQDGTLSINARVIDWDDVPGAVSYRVRIYDGWQGTVHTSEYFPQTTYTIPDGVLTLGYTYSYRVYAYREQRPEEETDNHSMSASWQFARHHFTVVEAQEPPAPNNPPAAPVITGPPNETVDPDGSITLNTGAFTDPDGDTHQMTHWVVRRADIPANAEENPVIADTSDTDLTAHTVSGLTPGLKYSWTAGYEDAGGQIGWSPGSTFKVGTSVPDANGYVPPGATAADFAMVSFVQWPDNPSAGSVLGAEMGGIYDTQQYRIGTYDPLKNGGEYREYGDGLVIQPGKAYWIFARSGMGITVNGVPVSTTQDIEVSLAYNTVTSDGWNMIAPPNEKSYNWADVEVVEYDSEGRILFGPEAVSELAEGNPFIDKGLWRWANSVYTPDTQVMQPYAGYWVQALRPNISLRFPAGVTVRRTEPDTLLAGMSKRGREWLERLLPSPAMALAGTGDTPPPPMAGFTREPVDISGDDSSSGGGTCFITECGR